MLNLRTAALGLVLGAAALSASAAGAAVTVSWASLTSDDGSNVFGSIAAPSGGVNVTYSGGYSFDQLNGAGIDYWIATPPYTYTQGVVNRPTGSDIIALAAANTGTLTFSAPVKNVFVAFNSWNGAQVTFDHPFTIVSQGCGYWGCGTFVPNGTNTGFFGNGETVGVLEFAGTLSSLSFTDTVSENWHGLTVGVGDISTGVPEPRSWAVMLLGFAALGGALRLRRSRPVLAA